jgi:hypothetical protein
MGLYRGRALTLKVQTNNQSALFGADPLPGESYRTRVDRPVEINEFNTGSYTSYGECDADLRSRQISLFYQATGITPVVAYCYLNMALVSHPWAFRIDGFGKPRMIHISHKEKVPREWSVQRRMIELNDRLAAMKNFPIARAFYSMDFDREFLYLEIRYYGHAPVTFRRATGSSFAQPAGLPRRL